MPVGALGLITLCSCRLEGLENFFSHMSQRYSEMAGGLSAVRVSSAGLDDSYLIICFSRGTFGSDSAAPLPNSELGLPFANS